MDLDRFSVHSENPQDIGVSPALPPSTSESEAKTGPCTPNRASPTDHKYLANQSLGSASGDLKDSSTGGDRLPPPHQGAIEDVLRISIRGKQCLVRLQKSFLSPEEAGKIMTEFNKESLFKNDTRGSKVLQRKTQFYGDAGVTYKYDGEVHTAQSWPESL